MQTKPRTALSRGVIAVLLFCIVNVSTAETAPQNATEDDLSRRVANVIDGHIIPRLQQFVVSTNALSLDVANYCETGTPRDLAKVKASFKAAVLSWASVAHLRFGPFELEARARRLSFSPDPRGIVWRQLRLVLSKRDDALLKPGALAEQSIAIQGLSALDFLLAKPIRVGGKATSDETYKCALASAIAKNVRATSKSALMAWTKKNGWRERLLNPGGGNKVYESFNESASQLVESAMLGFQIIRDQQVAVLQNAIAEKTKLSRLPYFRAKLSAPYLVASIEGTCEFFDKLDLIAFVSEAKKQERELALNACRNLKQVAKNIEIPLSNAGLPGKLRESELRQLHDYTNGMRRIIGRDIAPAAGLTMGFNDLDGD